MLTSRVQQISLVVMNNTPHIHPHRNHRLSTTLDVSTERLWEGVFRLIPVFGGGVKEWLYGCYRVVRRSHS